MGRYTKSVFLYTSVLFTETFTRIGLYNGVFTAHGSTCTFLARYMKDHLSSPTAVICIGLHGLSSNPYIPWVRRSLLAPPTSPRYPAFLLVNHPLSSPHTWCRNKINSVLETIYFISAPSVRTYTAEIK